jgi:hypothetical protein
MYVVPHASSPVLPNTEDRAAYVVTAIEIAVEIVVVNHSAPGVKKQGLRRLTVVAALQKLLRVLAQALVVMPFLAW